MRFDEDFKPQPNDVANAVLSKSTWAVLGLTLDIELFTQAHYRSSIDPDTEAQMERIGAALGPILAHVGNA